MFWALSVQAVYLGEGLGVGGLGFRVVWGLGFLVAE